MWQPIQSNSRRLENLSSLLEFVELQAQVLKLFLLNSDLLA
jgi:hypothetical protein